MAYRDGHGELVALGDELVRLGWRQEGSTSRLNPDPTGRGTFEPSPTFTDKLYCWCHGQLVSWFEPCEGGTIHRWSHCPTGKPDPRTIKRGRNGKGKITCR